MASLLASCTARPTHFLSIPISSEFLAHKLDQFHSSILSSSFGCKGIDRSMLVSPENLHITVGVSKLMNQSEIQRALEFLKNDLLAIVHSIIKGNPISVHIQGLKTMQEDPSKAHVVYTEAHDESTDRLLNNLCVGLKTSMVNAGLMVKEDRPLKIHITLINTSYRKVVKAKDNRREPFDARPILDSFGDIDFGVVQPRELHLMRMGKRGPNDTYESIGSIALD
ncbi:kinase A anchor protein [Phycomyces nitens]|nr:kinase A anchor protein [Phycomyces nitens]